jgi:hypothetical protein
MLDSESEIRQCQFEQISERQLTGGSTKDPVTENKRYGYLSSMIAHCGSRRGSRVREGRRRAVELLATGLANEKPKATERTKLKMRELRKNRGNKNKRTNLGWWNGGGGRLHAIRDAATPF